MVSRIFYQWISKKLSILVRRLNSRWFWCIPDRITTQGDTSVTEVGWPIKSSSSHTLGGKCIINNNENKKKLNKLDNGHLGLRGVGGTQQRSDLSHCV